MTPEEISPFVKKSLQDACQQVSDFLPDKTALSEDAKARILKKYVAAIEGNFVSWMGATVICARSVQGRYAASENLWVEMKDDHAGMLRAFAKSAKCEPEATDYQDVETAVGDIRKMVGDLSGLECLTLMATLENTSGVFVPWLEKVAQDLGSDNLQYTKIHGEADIEHADQFAWAVSHEMECHDNSEAVVSHTIDKTVGFLKSLFC